MNALRLLSCAALAALSVSACDTAYRRLTRARDRDASVDAAADGSSPAVGRSDGAPGGGAAGTNGTSGASGVSGGSQATGGESGTTGAGGSASSEAGAAGGGGSTECTTPGLWDMADWDRSCWQ
jgi:hypothetical protein